MRNRLIMWALLLTLLMGLGAVDALATDGISGLELTAQDSTTLLVAWNNPQNAKCRVYSYVDGHDTYYEKTVTDDHVTLLLVPEVTYRIVVEDLSKGGARIEGTVEMPKASPYKDGGYRISKRRVYVYTDAEKAMWNQSYNNLGTIAKADLLTGIDEGRVYALYFEVGFTKTSEPKVIHPMLVLKTPDGDIYTRFGNELVFDGSWPGARYYFGFNDLILTCNNMDGLIPGQYTMEAYQDGKTLGSGNFTIAE